MMYTGQLKRPQVAAMITMETVNTATPATHEGCSANMPHAMPGLYTWESHK